MTTKINNFNIPFEDLKLLNLEDDAFINQEHKARDLDGDGDSDLFLGFGSFPQQGDFPQYPAILENNGDGSFSVVEIKNQTLKSATDMVVDGMDAAVIDATLTTDIALARERAKASVDYLKFLAEVAPSMGMVGTMIGLVAMLKSMDDLGSIGDSFAIALLTTMWGAIFAYVLFKPFAEKLDIFSKVDLEAGMLIKEGMLLVKANTNPRVIADRLSTRLAPNARAELAASQEAA